MAQARAKLKVSQRDTFGSRATRRLRREGLVPGVVYGQGGEARPFQVPARELRTVLAEGQTLLDLELEDSKAVPVVIKEQQHHPVRGDVMHLDFLEVRLDEAIEAEVAIELEGTDQAPGVREGGVLEHVTREVTVEALPTDIPERITVDVSEMDINDTINLASVAVPSGVKFMADEPEEITIATLSPPRVEEEPEPEVEEETELVGEGEEAPEGEEGAEGEEAAEGEGGGDGERRRRGLRRQPVMGLLDRLFGRRGQRGSGGDRFTRDDSYQYVQPPPTEQSGGQGDSHHQGGHEPGGSRIRQASRTRTGIAERPVAGPGRVRRAGSRGRGRRRRWRRWRLRWWGRWGRRGQWRRRRRLAAGRCAGAAGAMNPARAGLMP